VSYTLVNRLQDRFELENNKCPICGHTVFRVELKGPVYIVNVKCKESNEEEDIFDIDGPDI